MNNPEKTAVDGDLQKQADRTRRIIYIVMAVLMVLPFVVAWLTGAFHF